MATGFQQSFQNVKRMVIFLNVQGNGRSRDTLHAERGDGGSPPARLLPQEERWDADAMARAPLA